MRDLSEQQIRVPRLFIRPRQQARPLFVFDFVGCPVVLVGYAGFLWERSFAADFAYEFGKEAGAHHDLQHPRCCVVRWNPRCARWGQNDLPLSFRKIN